MEKTRARSGEWMEVVAEYHKNVDGRNAKVKERYAVEAPSFTIGEASTIRALVDNGTKTKDDTKDINIRAMSIPAYRKVVINNVDADAENYYKVKVLTTYGEGEKPSAEYFLVQASTNEQAREIADRLYRDTMIDYEVADVVKTAIVGIIEGTAK